MTRTLCTFLALLLAAVPLQAQAVAPVPIVQPTAYTWDEQASSLAQAQSYTYKVYKDDRSPGIVIVGAVCSAPVATTPAGHFPCEAPFPAEIPGIAHSIVITALTPAGIESGPSNPFAYIVTVQAAAPKNLRKK